MTGRVKELSPPDSFAARLCKTMLQRRMTVGRLARETQISERLLRKYRNGTSEPRDHFGDATVNGRKIAFALDVPVDELLPPTEREAA